MSGGALVGVLFLLGELVSVMPSVDMVRLGDAEESRFELTVRNMQVTGLDKLYLDIETERCEVSVRPETIAHCHPSDRCRFEITIKRQADTPETRFPILMTLSAEGHPKLSRFRMLVDALPGAVPPAARDGWIDVGVLRVEGDAGRKRGWILAMLGLLPVIGLLVLGAWLKRRAK